MEYDRVDNVSFFSSIYVLQMKITIFNATIFAIIWEGTKISLLLSPFVRSFPEIQTIHYVFPWDLEYAPHLHIYLIKKCLTLHNDAHTSRGSLNMLDIYITFSIAFDIYMFTWLINLTLFNDAHTLRGSLNMPNSYNFKCFVSNH